MTHPFEAAIDLRPGADHRLLGRTVPRVRQHGGPVRRGATAAALLHAIEQHPDRSGDPVALTVNFAAPVADGQFTIDTTLVRANRSNQHWTATMSQDDGVVSTATAVFSAYAATPGRAPRR